MVSKGKAMRVIVNSVLIATLQLMRPEKVQTRR